MRFLFSFFIIFLSTVISEEYFYVSYRGVLDNNLLKTERFHISKVMALPKKLQLVSEFTTDIVDEEEKLKVSQFFKINQDLITQELFKAGVFVNERSDVKKNSQNTKVVLMFPPTIISLSVKENFVKISVYK